MYRVDFKREERVLKKETLRKSKSFSDAESSKKAEIVSKMLINPTPVRLNLKINKFTNAKSLENESIEKIKKSQKICSIHQAQDDYLAPKLFFQLPVELVQEILKHLRLSELAKIAQLNANGRVHQKISVTKYAREFGYSGNNYFKSVNYLKDIFSEITYIHLKSFLPQNYFSFKKQMLDLEESAQKLKSLKERDIFTLLSNEKAYNQSDCKLKKVFSLISWKANSIQFSNEVRLIEEKEKALILSAKYGWVSNVELLLKLKVNVNARFENGNSALHFAAQNGHLGVVKTLLQHGADIDCIGVAGCTPLIFAVGYGHYSFAHPRIKIVQALLKNGASPNTSAQNRSSALHFAAQKGYLKIVKLLFKYGAYVNKKGAGGSTPLCFACGYGARLYSRPNLAVVKWLLANGADQSILLDDGTSASDLAILYGEKEMQELLLIDKHKKSMLN